MGASIVRAADAAADADAAAAASFPKAVVVCWAVSPLIIVVLVRGDIGGRVKVLR